MQNWLSQLKDNYKYSFFFINFYIDEMKKEDFFSEPRWPCRDIAYYYNKNKE